MWQLSHPRDKWPRYVWRVVHAGTQSWPDDSELLLVSGAAWRDPSITGDNMDLFTFLQKMANHVDWYNRDGPSCFLSVFTNADHAQQWGLGRNEQGNGPVQGYMIDTALLPAGVRLFDMESLTPLVDLRPNFYNPGDEEKTYKFYQDELLFFGRIPREAVVRVLGLGSSDWAHVQRQEESRNVSVHALSMLYPMASRLFRTPRVSFREGLSRWGILSREKLLRNADQGFMTQNSWYYIPGPQGEEERRFAVPRLMAVYFGYIQDSDQVARRFPWRVPGLGQEDELEIVSGSDEDSEGVDEWVGSEWEEEEEEEDLDYVEQEQARDSYEDFVRGLDQLFI